jgi:GNAT superfamily N-acetyltransferase
VIASNGPGVFLAIRGGSIVGFVWLEVVERSHLRSLFVRPDLIRHKIGTLLLTAAEDYGRRSGVQELNVSASLNSVPFYLANGYRVDREFAHWFVDATEANPEKLRFCKMTKHMSVRYSQSDSLGPEAFGCHSDWRRSLSPFR